MTEASSTDQTTLYGKMAAIMGELTPFSKDSKHQIGYKYTSAVQVYDLLRQLLSKYNIGFFAEVTGYEMTVDRYVIQMAFTFACGDTGMTIRCPWLGEAVHTYQKKGGGITIDDKAISKCVTVSEKYFLMKTFIVTSEDDPDGDASDPRKAARKRSAPKPKQNGNAPGTHAGVKLDENGLAKGYLTKHVKRVDDQGTRHSFMVDPLGKVIVWGNTDCRKTFINTGWIDENEWDDVDVVEELNPPIPALFAPSGDKWWDLHTVLPHPELERS